MAISMEEHSSSTNDVGFSADKVMDAAQAIGIQLVEQGYRDPESGEVNWMSRRDYEKAWSGKRPTLSIALSSELYGGSAGVVLFLVELARYRPEPSFFETIEGAFLRSVSYARHNPPPGDPLSFYSGLAGIWYVGLRMQSLFPGRFSLDEELAWLEEQVLLDIDGEHVLDLIGGNSGIIPWYLKMHQQTGRKIFQDHAHRLGKELIDHSERKGDLAWWPPSMPDHSGPQKPYTGFSHGASGMAYGLLSLYEASGEKDFLDVARAAYAYEDSMFHAPSKNWLDPNFQQFTEDGQVVGNFQTAWCHGAPGITVSRTLAAVYDPGRAGHHREMANAGVSTTSAHLKQRLAFEGWDTSLCHGAAGLNEIMLGYGSLLGDNSYVETARENAMRMISLYKENGNWPSGVHAGGQSPCLMIGSAGVGYHFLRLVHGNEVPPLLWMEV